MAPEVTPVVSSPWTPVMVTALFAGIIGVIGALGKVIVDLKKAKAAAVEAKAEVEASRVIGERAGKARDSKLDEIKMLVDGRFSQVLTEVARLKRQIANATGRPEHIKAAEDAEADAAEQRKKVEEAGAQIAELKQSDGE